MTTTTTAKAANKTAATTKASDNAALAATTQQQSVAAQASEAAAFIAAAQAHLDSTPGLTKDQLCKVLQDALLSKLSDGTPVHKSFGPYVSRATHYFDTQGKNVENRVGRAEGTMGSSRALRALFTQEMAIYGVPAGQKQVINKTIAKFTQMQRRWLASDDSAMNALGVQAVPADKLSAVMAKIKAEKAAAIEAKKANQAS